MKYLLTLLGLLISLPPAMAIENETDHEISVPVIEASSLPASKERLFCC
jgi:hypothetical protein